MGIRRSSFRCIEHWGRHIEKNFSVQRDDDGINNVRNRIAVYEDSVRQHHEMVELTAYKDSVASALRKEVEKTKKIIR